MISFSSRGFILHSLPSCYNSACALHTKLPPSTLTHFFSPLRNVFHSFLVSACLGHGCLIVHSSTPSASVSTTISTQPIRPTILVHHQRPPIGGTAAQSNVQVSPLQPRYPSALANAINHGPLKLECSQCAVPFEIDSLVAFSRCSVQAAEVPGVLFLRGRDGLFDSQAGRCLTPLVRCKQSVEPPAPGIWARSQGPQPTIPGKVGR